MDFQYDTNCSSIGTARDERLWVDGFIATARVDFELLRGGRVKFEELSRVRRDCHGRTKMEEWITATGQ